MTPRHKRETLTFVGLSFGLSWLVALPLWLDERGLEAPFALPLTVAVMFTPSIAVLGVHLVHRPGDLKATLGFGRGDRRYGLWMWALVLPLILTLLSLVLAALLGVYATDLRGLSGLTALITDAGGAEVFDVMPVHVLAALMIPQALLGGVINSVPAMGEELGWRGYLLPRLLPLGKPAAVIVSGLIWGLWHAPLILLGHNYPDAPVLGVALFCVTCVLLGAMLAAVRLATESVWPAAIAHGAINATAGMPVVFASGDNPVDPVHVGVTGWTWWIVAAACIALVAFTPKLKNAMFGTEA